MRELCGPDIRWRHLHGSTWISTFAALLVFLLGPSVKSFGQESFPNRADYHRRSVPARRRGRSYRPARRCRDGEGAQKSGRGRE